MLLGVNIDHVATLRNARGTSYPSPIEAALVAETYGADSITLHLREDRRHVKDEDVRLMRGALKTKMNLEMALTDEMIKIALEVKPQDVCIVPEKREELTTEGGLDVVAKFDKLKTAIQALQDENIRVSLFIDPEYAMIKAASALGAKCVELHTGAYADAKGEMSRKIELGRIAQARDDAQELGLIVNAGHGLNYHNVKPIVDLRFHELNIGHAIIAQSIMVGLPKAVSDMKALISRR